MNYTLHITALQPTWGILKLIDVHFTHNLTCSNSVITYSFWSHAGYGMNAYLTAPVLRDCTMH